MALPFGFTPLEAQTYLILTICWVSIVVVNQLEQPYARSLVQCDVPVNTTEGAEFSGSQYCGHRLHVIGVGAEISGWGQSLENVGRVAITLFVSGFADYGRKRAALVGQFLITMSTVLFAMAQFLPTSLGIPTYIIAQGLQGMSGIGILDQIITGDVALQLNDTVAVYGRKQLFSTMMFFIMIPLIVYVQYAEITDFTFVWGAIVVLNTTAFVLLYLFFPETLHKKEDKKDFENFSIIGVAKEELRHFRSLFVQHPYIGPKICEELFNKMADCASIGLPFLMAHFAFSQFDALIFTWVPMIVGGFLLGGLVPALCAKHGHAKVWDGCFWYWRTTTVLIAFMNPLRFLGLIPMPILGAFIHLPLAGWPAVAQGVEIRLIQQENNAKYQAMLQLIGFMCGSVTSALYPHIFYAEATTYAYKVIPYALSASFILCTIPIYMYYCGPQQLAMCAQIDKEAKEKWEEEKKANQSAAEAEKDEEIRKLKEELSSAKTELSNMKEEKDPEKEAEKEPEVKTEEQKKAD